MKDYYCVMTFHSTAHALRFEKIFKDTDINVRLMPVPRQVSSSCGTAGEFPCDKKNEVLEICKREDIEMDSVHKIQKEKKKKNWFTKLMRRNE